MIKELGAGMASKDRSKWATLFWNIKAEQKMIKVFEILGEGWRGRRRFTLPPHVP